jgi:non-homologous end joining protein Ku
VKTYYFERRLNRESIRAQSVEEARTRLEEMGYLQDEFELVDVTDDSPPPAAKVIDLMAALKESLARRNA